FSALTRYWGGWLPRAPAPRAAAPAPKAPAAREAAKLAGLVAAAVVAALGLRSCVRPYRVLSASMLPTMEPDDLVGARITRPWAGAPRPPRRGDVVVFRGADVASTWGLRALPEILVKRVIGLPGDHISMLGGAPVINGWQVPTCDAGD